MKITEIRTHLLSVPFSDPPKTGFLTLPNIDLLVVEVETDAGVVGTGHLHPLAGGMRTLEMCIDEMLKPLLIGEVADDVEALWRKMWQATFIQGRMGVTVMAMSMLCHSTNTAQTQSVSVLKADDLLTEGIFL